VPPPPRVSAAAWKSAPHTSIELVPGERQITVRGNINHRVNRLIDSDNTVTPCPTRDVTRSPAAAVNFQ
jgi:hypothetical protein